MDQQFLLLLALHLVTFCYFHSESGKDLMKAIEQSSVRKILQETFKGYGKALNLLESIRKAIKLETPFSYFIGVIIVRGSASSLFKQGLLSVLLRRPLRFEKPKTNFFMNTIPTILIFSCRYVISHWLPYVYEQEWLDELTTNIQLNFVIFMVGMRFVKIICKLTKKWLKKQRRTMEKKPLKIKMAL